MRQAQQQYNMIQFEQTSREKLEEEEEDDVDDEDEEEMFVARAMYG